MTGDGNLDIVVGAELADVGGVVDTGAIYVWQGGPTLHATPTPLATLTVAGAVANDQLGNASGQAIQFADVTGDGILDVVAAARVRRRRRRRRRRRDLRLEGRRDADRRAGAARDALDSRAPSRTTSSASATASRSSSPT